MGTGPIIPMMANRYTVSFYDSSMTEMNIDNGSVMHIHFHFTSEENVVKLIIQPNKVLYAEDFQKMNIIKIFYYDSNGIDIKDTYTLKIKEYIADMESTYSESEILKYVLKIKI